MRYIRSMELINFQSHKASQISFSENLNVISGPSDNGKSAIIRALKWVLYNEPKGTDFIRQGESTCRVSITLNDNTTIVRERSKSKNMYKLITSEGEENIFEGFGNEIPKEILLAHGINRFYIDSSSSDSINLAEQLEGPFLISQSGAIKAKAIGKLIGVNIIDEALKELNRDLSAIQNEDKRLSTELNDMKEKLKEFDYLEKNKKNIDRKEILINILRDKVVLFKRLEELHKYYTDIDKNIQEFKKTIAVLGNIDFALDLNLKAIEQNRFMDRLSMINSKLNYLNDEMEIERKILISTHKTDEAVNKFIKLQELTRKYEKLLYNREKYDNIIEDTGRSLKTIQSLKEINKTEDKFKNTSDLVIRLFKLEELRVKIATVDTSLSKGENYLIKLSNIEYSEGLYKNVIESFDKHEKLVNLKSIYKNLQDEVRTVNREIIDQDNSMKVITEEYMDILRRMGKCPVCLSPIEEHTMEHIIKEFKGVDGYE